MPRPGRPALPLGGMGTIRIYPHGAGFLARTLVRDYDGRVRAVARKAKSKTAARSALVEAVRTRHVDEASEFTPETKFSLLAEAWWTEYQGTNPSINTVRQYRDKLDRFILPKLGELRAYQITVARADRCVQSVNEQHGHATAKLTRSVLSGVCRFAARNDAMQRNVVTDIGKLTPGMEQRSKDALTVEQVRELREKIYQDEQARGRDIPDLMSFMMGTGLRIGEACAARWENFDAEAGTIEVGWMTVVAVPAAQRKPGEPRLRLVDRTPANNKGHDRTLELSDWVVEMLTARRRWVTGSMIFPAPLGLTAENPLGLRDPSNTQGDMKDALTIAGFGWATSHTFRRTVITLMEEGLGLRRAGDQVGHRQLRTTEGYVHRKLAAPKGAREILEDFG